MIKVTYDSKSKNKPVKRYIRKSSRYENAYSWCEVGESTRDIRQGTCDAEDLPVEIKAKCDSNKSTCNYACEWPLED